MRVLNVLLHSEKSKMSLTAVPLPTFPITDSRNIDTSPAVSECTVAQAAQFLDVSEGYVTEMLNAGRVLYRQENGEHLIEWNSLRDYRKEWKRRHAVLDEMVRLNQEMGLYDD
jgi:hypothetical protein